MENNMEKINFLTKKANWVRRETLKIHKISPETRVASSLSAVEIFTTLYYGDILKFNPKEPLDDVRDRFIISKGHGSISMYPLLADLGFYDMSELNIVSKKGSFLGGIPDPIIPGYETINGSLGHGLGVGCGIALGLKERNSDSKVYVIVGDGELNEGSNWEAIMFANQHNINNLTLIIDNNRASMLDFSKNILNLESISEKFEAFNWNVEEVDGHNINELYNIFEKNKTESRNKPKVIIANTIKGKGVEFLEKSPLSHILSIKPEDIDKLID